MPTYLNWKGPKGRETVDEFEREPNQTAKEFREHVDRMIAEYHLAQIFVYRSFIPCANWRDD